MRVRQVITQCTKEIPNTFASGDSLAHILARLKSLGAPEPDEIILPTP